MSSILDRVQTVEVEGISIPKRGCLTVGEMREYIELVKEAESIAQDKLKIEADMEFAERCVSIILKRVSPTWTLENTRSEYWCLPIAGEMQAFQPDHLLLEALFEFFTSELQRGKTQAEVQAEVEADPKAAKRRTGTKSS